MHNTVQYSYIINIVQEYDEQQSHLEELLQKNRHLDQERMESKRSITTIKKDWEKERKTRIELENKIADFIR